MKAIFCIVVATIIAVGVYMNTGGYIVAPQTSRSAAQSAIAEPTNRAELRYEAIFNLGWIAGNSRPYRTSKETAELTAAYNMMVSTLLADLDNASVETRDAYMTDKGAGYKLLFETSMSLGASKPYSPGEIERRAQRFSTASQQLTLLLQTSATSLPLPPPPKPRES